MLPEKIYYLTPPVVHDSALCLQELLRSKKAFVKAAKLVLLKMFAFQRTKKWRPTHSLIQHFDRLRNELKSCFNLFSPYLMATAEILQIKYEKGLM